LEIGMNNLQEATERICELKGSVLTQDVLTCAIVHTLPAQSRLELAPLFAKLSEAARTVLLNTPVGELVISSFEREVQRANALVASVVPAASTAEAPLPNLDPALLTTTRVHTFNLDLALTAASGFFFERGERLFLVTSRHVLIDLPSGHHPSRVEIELHTHPSDLTQYQRLSLDLYANGLSLWRQGVDSGGEIDVAVLEVDRSRLPAPCLLRAFTPEHLARADETIDIGSALSVPGFPLGFHDTVHHLPVVRQAAMASQFGVRFQGKGHFLTDARTHRGSSGAPVLQRVSDAGSDPEALRWKLLGVHSTRLDMNTRDLAQDESLGLNSAWYADILLTLTEP
jgi:S1-C subfamily serine protease